MPLTAGTVISFSSFGSFDGNGEATWQTKSHPLTTSSQTSLLVKSASTSSIFSSLSPAIDRI